MDFHLNTLQDAVTISEHRANSTQARLAEAKTRIMGEIFITIIRSFNLAFKILLISSLNFFQTYWLSWKASDQLRSMRQGLSTPGALCRWFACMMPC
jgi:hypothetical protein